MTVSSYYVEWQIICYGFSSVQSLRVSNSLQPHGMQCASLPCSSPTPRACSNSHLLSRWYHPIILSSVVPFSPALNLSQLQGHFQWVNLHIRWSKYWSFSFSISPCNEYWGLISLKIASLISLQSKEHSSLLQHHSSKASIPRRSAFFMVQFSHPYKITGTTIFFTRWTFVNKVMSLLFNMLPRLLIEFCLENALVIANTFFQQNKRRLYTWI